MPLREEGKTNQKFNAITRIMDILCEIAARNFATIVRRMAISLGNVEYDSKIDRHRHFV